MNARSILYGIILGLFILVNGAVRLYLAVPIMPTTPFTEEEMALAIAQFGLAEHTQAASQMRLADSNAVFPYISPISQKGLDVSQTVEVTNTAQGGRMRDNFVPQPSGRVPQVEATGNETADSTGSLPRGDQAEADARHDLQLGSPKFFVTGLPIRHGRIWQELLRREHGIHLELLGCTPVPPSAEYARRYNAVVLPVFQQAYGADFLAVSEVKAREEFAHSPRIQSATPREKEKSK